jgi:hypothetical protein
MTTYRILGINDDTDTCECCGKTGLKRVVWIATVSEGGFVSEPVPHGTTCAYTKINGRKPHTVAKAENSLLAKQAEDKAQMRSDYFRNECFLDVDGKFYIEKKYKIGRIMQEKQISRNEAVSFVRAEMKKEHWFLS